MRAFQNATYRPHWPRRRKDMAVMMLCYVIVEMLRLSCLIQKVLSGAALQSLRKTPMAYPWPTMIS